MDKHDKAKSNTEIYNWFWVNIYFIIIPPIAKALITLIIGYGIDIKAIFTDYSLVVFAIFFNVISLIYEKYDKFSNNEKKELTVQSKWLLVSTCVCCAFYLFSAIFKLPAIIIFGIIVTVLFAYCIKMAKNIWHMIQSTHQETPPPQDTNKQSIDERAVNRPPEEC